MAGFFLHRSNATEALIGALSSVLSQPLSSPWARETIVVQGRGMERWLAMELANTLGIWAGARFPFPRAFIDEVLSRAIESASEEESFSALPLTLTIADELARDDDESVRRYVRDDSERRYALARRLADLFDRYLVFRPDWILNGFPDPSHWQACLWRRVEGRLGGNHFAARVRDARRRLESGPVGGLPQRVSIFGISGLPPSYLGVLDSLSQHLEVHAFLLTPTAEYWGESRRQFDLFGTQEAGPRLLNALGQHARSSQALMESVRYRDGIDTYARPGTVSLLRVLQSDILSFRERSPAGPHRPVALRSGDESVQVHVCHSPMREVQVVHDVLLDAFATDRRLAPHRVAVMVPRVDEYAPYVEAVFSTRGRIPYRITDRSFARSDPEQRALEAWLTLLRGRVSSAEMLDLLTHQVIRDAFGIEESELGTLRHWVVDAGIRWGIDAKHRVYHGQPDDPTGTWRFGLDRLWMGFAVDAEQHLWVAGIAPESSVTGSRVELLGKLDRLVSLIASEIDVIGDSRTLGEWGQFVEVVVDRFTAPTSRLRSAAREQTEKLEDAVNRYGGQERVRFESAATLVLEPLRRDSAPYGFVSGSVTICELLPMRSVPFDLVVVMGMNDGEFPRSIARSSLDLSLSRPRLGDPNPLADDRNLFLEAFLSARKKFIVTYIGRRIADNEPLPPSSVVSELLEACRSASRDDRTPEMVVRQHPLHPFSPRYFDEASSLFTYEERYAQVYKGANTLTDRPFVSVAREEPALDTVELNDLIAMLRAPERYFVRFVLGASTLEEGALVQQRESLTVNGLERWLHTDSVVDALERERDPQGIVQWLQGRGALPLGSLGALAAGDLCARATSLLAEAEQYRGEHTVEWTDAILDLGSIRLAGRLTEIFGRRRVSLSPSRVGDTLDMKVWIPHLLGCAIDCIEETVVLGLGARDEVLVETYERVDAVEARAQLTELLSVFRLGLRVPLPLFRRASPAYVNALSAGANDTEARQQAVRAFRQERRYDRPDERKIFSDESIITAALPVCGLEEAEFGRLARRVFGSALRGSPS